MDKFYNSKVIEDIYRLINFTDENNYYIFDMIYNRLEAADIMSRIYMSFTFVIISIINIAISAYIKCDVIMFCNIILFIGSIIGFMYNIRELQRNGQDLDKLIVDRRTLEHERFQAKD